MSASVEGALAQLALAQSHAQHIEDITEDEHPCNLLRQIRRLIWSATTAIEAATGAKCPPFMVDFYMLDRLNLFTREREGISSADAA